MLKHFIPALALIAVSACEHSVQNTSGQKYLNATPAIAGKLDQRIVKAASVEPLLRFPARIGLARIINGQITAIPSAEAQLWGALAEKHKAMGKFIPISPLIAKFAERQTRGGRNDKADIIDTIRIGAARQHLDAVLIYEVGARARSHANGLVLADLTIIGAAIIPSRSIKVQGVAQAILIDVRNAYPYATAQAEANISRLSVVFGGRGRMETNRLRAIEKTVENLVPEVEKMMQEVVVARAR